MKEDEIVPNHFFYAERQQTILKRLKENGRVTVTELTKLFSITPATVRRQLNTMEEAGMLRRTHGGAIYVNEANQEHTLETKSGSFVDEKRAIVRCARKYIQNGDTIILGGGTTILELAYLLQNAADLIVITDSLPAAMALYQNKNIEVQLCGGTVREKTGVIIGSPALHYLRDIRVSKTFIGADSISIQHGITTPNQFEAEVEEQLARCGRDVFVLADSSKMDRISLAKQTTLAELDYLITDGGIDTAFKEKLRKSADVQIIIADK